MKINIITEENIKELINKTVKSIKESYTDDTEGDWLEAEMKYQNSFDNYDDYDDNERIDGNIDIDYDNQEIYPF